MTGVDIEAEQRRSDDLDAAHRRLDDQRMNREEPLWTEDTWRDVQARRADTEAAGRDLAGQVDESFAEGFGEGYRSTTGAIKGAVNFPLKFIWDALPWWVWVSAAGYGAWRLGLLKKVLR
ncbi:MAG: hypothetical protein AAB368_01755 [bacterium]